MPKAQVDLSTLEDVLRRETTIIAPCDVSSLMGAIIKEAQRAGRDYGLLQEGEPLNLAEHARVKAQNEEVIAALQDRVDLLDATRGEALGLLEEAKRLTKHAQLAQKITRFLRRVETESECEHCGGVGWLLCRKEATQARIEPCAACGRLSWGDAITEAKRFVRRMPRPKEEDALKELLHGVLSGTLSDMEWSWELQELLARLEGE